MTVSTKLCYVCKKSQTVYGDGVCRSCRVSSPDYVMLDSFRQRIVLTEDESIQTEMDELFERSGVPTEDIQTLREMFGDDLSLKLLHAERQPIVFFGDTTERVPLDVGSLIELAEYSNLGEQIHCAASMLRNGMPAETIEWLLERDIDLHDAYRLCSRSPHKDALIKDILSEHEEGAVEIYLENSFEMNIPFWAGIQPTVDEVHEISKIDDRVDVSGYLAARQDLSHTELVAAIKKMKSVMDSSEDGMLVGSKFWLDGRQADATVEEMNWALENHVWAYPQMRQHGITHQEADVLFHEHGFNGIMHSPKAMLEAVATLR